MYSQKIEKDNLTNIVFIFSPDQLVDYIGAEGNNLAYNPNYLDLIARRGFFFQSL